MSESGLRLAVNGMHGKACTVAGSAHNSARHDRPAVPRRSPARRLSGGGSLVALTAHMVAAAVLRVTVLPISTPTSVAGSRFGESVAGLGEINGDGVGDLIVGAPGADRVFMLSGARTVVKCLLAPRN